MADVKLYIEGKLCDLSGKESIEVDYTNFDILKIDSRGGARSYSFNLPKTNRNKQVLENPEMISNLSNVPYLRMRCELLVDGVDTLIRFCEVSSVKDSYKINLYGANSDVFAEIKDLKLRDIDMDEYDHFWNYYKVWDGIYYTANYGYGIIDYHSDSPNSFITNDSIFANYMLPFVYVNRILEKIFEAIDYTVVNSIASDTVNMIVPSYSEPLRSTSGSRYEATLSSTDTFAIPDIPNGGPTILSFQSVDSQGASYFIQPYTTDKIYFADDITMHVTLTLRITSIDVPGVFNDCILSYSYTDRETVGGGGVGSGQIPIAVDGGTNTYTVEFDVTLKQAITDGYVYMEFVLVAPTGYNGIFTLETGATIEFSDVVIDNPLTLTYDPPVANTFDYVTPSSILPDITQMEFLSSYMQMFCLYPVVNYIDKTVTLKRFDSLVESGNGILDWSEKIDLTEEPEITFIQSAYGQHNKFVYTQDGDEQKPVGTDGEITINNQNLEFEKTVVELPFAATQANIRLYDNLVAQIGIFEAGEYTNEKEPRILNVRRGFASADKYLEDTLSHFQTIGGAVNIPYFIDASQTFNLGFADNLIPNYYQVLTDVLGRVKIVKQLVRLSAADVSLIDFSKIVWIAKYESYFYINSIKGFSLTESKSTLVELVKLNING